MSLYPRVDRLTVKLPNGFHTRLDYSGNGDILNEAYASLYIIKEADGIPGKHFTARKKTPLSAAWDDAYDLLCKPDKKRDPVLKITAKRLSNLLLIHRLGLSLAMLEFRKIPTMRREVVRLVERTQFLKSEYVLYIARECVWHGHSVEFLEDFGRSGMREADLLVDSALYVECKARDSNAKIRESVADGRKQIPKTGPGIVCVDLPAKVDLSDSATQLKLAADTKSSLGKTERVNGLVLTQVNMYQADEVGVANVVRRKLYVKKGKVRTPYRLPEDIFGHGEAV